MPQESYLGKGSHYVPPIADTGNSTPLRSSACYSHMFKIGKHQKLAIMTTLVFIYLPPPHLKINQRTQNGFYCKYSILTSSQSHIQLVYTQQSAYYKQHAQTYININLTCNLSVPGTIREHYSSILPHLIFSPL